MPSIHSFRRSSFASESSAASCSFTSILLSSRTPDFSFGMMVKFGTQGIRYSEKDFPLRLWQRSSKNATPLVAMLLKLVRSPVS